MIDDRGYNDPTRCVPGRPPTLARWSGVVESKSILGTWNNSTTACCRKSVGVCTAAAFAAAGQNAALGPQAGFIVNRSPSLLLRSIDPRCCYHALRQKHEPATENRPSIRHHGVSRSAPRFKRATGMANAAPLRQPHRVGLGLWLWLWSMIRSNT